MLMFLSKKNAIYFNKPKGCDIKKPPRVLAGWEDEEEEKQENYQYNFKAESKAAQSNLLVGDEFVDLTADRQQKKQSKEKYYLNWDELDAKDDIECEKRLIEDIVQPGGIRIKPNDNMLNELLKQTKGMDVHIIGSLLLSKLEANYSFQIKAKALYTIEFLIKKNDKFLSYFKAHVDKLSEFPEPEDNVDNYRKILKVVLNFIGISNPVPFDQEENKPVFVDPGYNDDPKSKISNFIQENANKSKKAEQKKAIIGPGQMKAKATEQKKNSSPPTQQQQNKNIINNDFFSLDLLGTGSTTSQPVTFNNNSNGNGNGNQLSFDQMMGVSTKTSNGNNNINLLI